MENILASQVIAKLKERKLTISTAESLTGGLISQKLTEVSGSSEVFQGSIIAYSDEIKINVLGVEKQTILEFTSISEQVALEMATNIRKKMKTGVGISTTGVAGPAKSAGFEPGLVFVAVALDGHNMCQKLELKGDREQIRAQTTDEVFRLILSQLV